MKVEAPRLAGLLQAKEYSGYRDRDREGDL